MEMVRIYEIPDCKMVSSGIGNFGEGKFGRFEQWFVSLPQSIYPQDFLFWDGEGFHWLWIYTKDLNVPDEFDIIDFKGGLYAVCCGIDQQTDMDTMYKIKREFLDKFDYEIDESRSGMGHNVTSTAGNNVLGYNQMDYWTPIKQKSK